MMTPENFPLLYTASTRPVRFESAIADIAGGIEAGMIRKVVFDDAKSTLSDAVYNGWGKHITDIYIAGKWDKLPFEIRELKDKIRVMYLHDAISANKKLNKTKVNAPVVDAMRAFVAEVLPLALAVEALKEKVVKGRAPSLGPSKPANPNKIVKTCPCCFRQIAVVRQKMAHHGYERPGNGWQTESCFGVRFKPLEVSNEGLVWIRGYAHDQLVATKRQYADRNTLTSITVRNGLRFIEVKIGSPQWQRVFDARVSEIKRNIQWLKHDIKEYDKRLSIWMPETEVVIKK